MDLEISQQIFYLMPPILRLSKNRPGISFIIYPMQVWRTTPSSPGTSCMIARLIGPQCYVLTSFLRKVLLSSRSRLVHFAMSTSMAPEGSEIFHRKESFLVSLLASEGKTDEGQEFDPIHDRRVNGKSLFATFQARRS